jgi:hypothetical protein
MMRNPSAIRTRPAPRDVHTLYLRVFRSANLLLASCEYLMQVNCVHLKGDYHPYPKRPQCSPCQKICHINLRPVNSRLHQLSCCSIIHSQTFLNLALKRNLLGRTKDINEISTSDRKKASLGTIKVPSFA